MKTNNALQALLPLIPRTERVEVWHNLDSGRAEITLRSGAARLMVLSAGADGDGLYSGAEEVLPVREFSLHEYGKLDTPELRACARKYIRRVLWAKMPRPALA